MNLSTISRERLVQIASEIREMAPVTAVNKGEVPEASNYLKKSPYDFQKPIIQRVVDGFRKGNSRGKMILPCGSGKTLVSLWIKEALNGVTKTLFVVPSLPLLKQTLDEWRKNSNKEFDYLCICSEEDVDRGDSADVGMSVAEVAPWEKVTTFPQSIKRYLSSPSQREKVIFSTYHSLHRVVEAIGSLKSFSFDLVLCDEAHKTTGLIAAIGDPHAGRKFTLVHDNKKLPAKRRLYMTATPKIITKEGDEHSSSAPAVAAVAEMSDEKIYGPEFAGMSFKQVIDLGKLSDYQIIGVGVTNSEVLEALRGEEDADRWLVACAVAAVKVSLNPKYKIKHSISFHSTVNKAKLFANVLRLMFKKLAPEQEVSIEHINGKIPASKRAIVLKDFAKRSGINFITNAKCLTEGVDVPTIDGVFFCDPKKSVVDIVQAVGRALRVAEGKKFGYVIVPLFHDLKEGCSTPTEMSNFTRIVRVIRAMAANDSRIEAELSLNFNSSEGLKPAEEETGGGRIVLDGFEVELSKTIFDQVIERSVDIDAENKRTLLSWDETKRPSAGSSNQTESRLGRALSSYTNAKNNYYGYDRKFDEEIRVLKPQWFDSSLLDKSKLLNWDENSKPQVGATSEEERRLARVLYKITRKGYHGYDEVFDNDIRETKPKWFNNDDVEVKKIELLCWDAEKPPNSKSADERERQLAGALQRYTNEKSPSFDGSFTKDIRQDKPNWYRDTVSENKSKIMDWDPSSRPRVGSSNSEEKKLGQALDRYMNPNNTAYDAQFTLDVKKTKPEWFSGRRHRKRAKKTTVPTPEKPQYRLVDSDLVKIQKKYQQKEKSHLSTADKTMTVSSKDYLGLLLGDALRKYIEGSQNFLSTPIDSLVKDLVSVCLRSESKSVDQNKVISTPMPKDRSIDSEPTVSDDTTGPSDEVEPSYELAPWEAIMTYASTGYRSALEQNKKPGKPVSDELIKWRQSLTNLVETALKMSHNWPALLDASEPDRYRFKMKEGVVPSLDSESYNSWLDWESLLNRNPSFPQNDSLTSSQHNPRPTKESKGLKKYLKIENAIWTEGVPYRQPFLGRISAPEAREILRNAVQAEVSLRSCGFLSELNDAPFCWIKNNRPTEAFYKFITLAATKSSLLGRGGRFALARLLFCKLSEIDDRIDTLYLRLQKLLYYPS